MLDVLFDTLLDTAKLLPFLFLTYLLMEYLEHKSGDSASRMLSGSGKIGSLVGATLGLLPQCSLSAAASGLYAGRVITVGTLLSVYLASSDEMLPILISNRAPAGAILRILAAKWVCGVLFGFLVDLIARLTHRTDSEVRIEELCEREHCHCEDEDNVFLSALRHTVQVTVFLLIVIFAFNTAIHFIGDEAIAGFMNDHGILSVFLAGIVGLIPNCASSVILTQLYLGGLLSPACMMSGLLVNAGVGTLVLVRNNRPFKNSAFVIFLLYVIGIAVGLLVAVVPALSAFLSV